MFVFETDDDEEDEKDPGFLQTFGPAKKGTHYGENLRIDNF